MAGATFTFEEAQGAPAPPQASAPISPPAPSATAPQGNVPVALPGGGGIWPDGSVTTDPGTWQRWLAQGGFPSPSPPRSAPPAPTSNQASPPTPPAPTASTFSFEEARTPAPGDPTAGKLTGVAANIGAGANDAIADTLGAPVNLVTGALNLGSRGIKAATGYDPGQISNPIGGSGSIKTLMGGIGADPRDVAPADDVERLARAGGAGAASTVLPWSIARALLVMAGVPGAIQGAFGAGSAATQGAAGFAGGVTGQVAQDAAPTGRALRQFRGKHAGGRHCSWQRRGHAGPDRQRRRSVPRGVPAPHGRRPAAARRPAHRRRGHGPARGAGGARGTAAATRARIGADDVPAHRRSRLGNLERAVAKNAPDQFNARAAAQNEARVAAIQNLAPANASPEAVGAAFRAQLDRIDQFHAAAEGSARATAHNATSALGGAVPATADQQTSALQRYGQTLRGGLAAANTSAKATESRLWQAIDPDGTLTVNMVPVRKAARDIVNAMPRNAAPMTGEPGAIFAIARLQKAVQPFSELTALRSRITDALRTELQTNGRTQTYGRLSQLLDSVHDAMQTSVEGQAAEDAHAVASGEMAPESGIQARVQSVTNQWEGEAPSGGNPGGAGGNATPGGLGGLPQLDRNGVPPAPGPGSTGRNPGLAPRASTVAPPLSLLSFLIARGGVRDEAGELAAMNAARQRVGLVRVNGGKTFDSAREAAEEAGYLPRNSTINDFLDAVNEELRGRKVYPHGWAPEADQSARSDREYQVARDQVLRAEEDTDERLSPDEIDHATELTARGMHPGDAIREAARAAEDRALAANTLRRAFSGEGMPTGAAQADLGLEEPGAARPATFDPEAAARYRAARDATAERHATYTNAPGIGAMLKPGRTAVEFAMGDSQVPAAIFNGGAGAAERMRAFMRAGGSRPELVRALRDYAAFDLRLSAERADGTLDPAKFAKWRDAHAEAMTTFPELAQRFQTAASASRALDAATASRVAAREAFEASAAARFLGDADPVASVGRILRSDTATARMSELARLTANDPAARAGLQRAVAEFMLRDLRSNTVLGGSEVSLLKSDAFQTFMRKSEDALARIFSPEQLAGMRNVAADLQRAQRSISGTKLQGGSNTAQDLAAGTKHAGHGQSALAQVIIAEAAGDIAGHAVGLAGKVLGITGPFAAIAAKGTEIATLIGNAMRQAGLKKVDDLVTEAMLHPEIARTLLMKAPNPPSAKFIGQTLAAQLRALAVNSSVTARRDQPPAPVPRYTGIATPSSAPPVSDGVSP